MIRHSAPVQRQRAKTLRMIKPSPVASVNWPKRAASCALLVIAALGAAGPAFAQGGDRWRMPADQLAPSSPRDGVRSGRQVPLGEVIGQLRQRYGGEMVNADQQGDPPVYRVRWKTRDGRLVDVQVDARTGAVMR